MQYHTLARDGQMATLRIFPWFSWLFALFALYNMVSIVLSVVEGRRAWDGGVITALALILAFVVFVLAVTGQYVVCRFDQKRGLFRIQRYGVLGYQLVERPLSELREIRLRIIRRSYARVLFVLASGEEIPATSYYLLVWTMRHLDALSAQLGVPIDAEGR